MHITGDMCHNHCPMSIYFMFVKYGIHVSFEAVLSFLGLLAHQCDNGMPIHSRQALVQFLCTIIFASAIPWVSSSTFFSTSGGSVAVAELAAGSAAASGNTATNTDTNSQATQLAVTAMTGCGDWPL